MPAPATDTAAAVEVARPGGAEDIGEKDHSSVGDEKVADITKAKEGALESPEIEAIPPKYDTESAQSRDKAVDDPVIVTGADAANHLLSMRDDGEPALTFRSIVLATILSGFQAVMYQIYMVSTVFLFYLRKYFLREKGALDEPPIPLKS